MLLERFLDFAELDSIPADLDLLIVTTDVLERTRWQPANEITTPVHAGVSSGHSIRHLERVRHEPLRRQVRTVEVTPRQAGATNVELTNLTHRHRASVGVEYVACVVRVEHADVGLV